MASSMSASELKIKLDGVRVLYHAGLKNADGTPQRFTINGQIKTWKSAKNRQRIYIPLKRGLYQFESINSVDEFFDNFNLT